MNSPLVVVEPSFFLKALCMRAFPCLLLPSCAAVLGPIMVQSPAVSDDQQVSTRAAYDVMSRDVKKAEGRFSSPFWVVHIIMSG